MATHSQIESRKCNCEPDKKAKDTQKKGAFSSGKLLHGQPQAAKIEQPKTKACQKSRQ
jgi:hypothetical protein